MLYVPLILTEAEWFNWCMVSLPARRCKRSLTGNVAGQRRSYARAIWKIHVVYGPGTKFSKGKSL